MAKMVKIKKISATNKLTNKKQKNVAKVSKKLKVPFIKKKHEKPLQNVEAATSSDEEEEEENGEIEEVTTKIENNKRKVVPKASGQKKARLEAKVKPPTLEEINNLKETQNLYHSNLFRLQVQQMLEEIKVKEKHISLINSWLEKFNTFLRGLNSDAEKKPINELHWVQKCAITVPFQSAQFNVLNNQNKNVYFQFIKPKTDAVLIGAAGTRTLLGPELVADVCVSIPGECFQKNNTVNYIYEHKRALYLTYLTWKLLQDASTFKGLSEQQLKFNYFGNNPLKPVLEIQPELNNDRLKVRLFVVAEESAFKLGRFVPWNNNIRETMFITQEEGTQEESDVTQWATPNYNANVLFDLTMQSNQSVLRDVFSQQRNLQEGLLLLKVWLRQRQLHFGYCGFNAHILAMYIVYLRQQKKLHATMSSYQVARIVWTQLAQSNWNVDGKGITLCKNNQGTNQPTLEQMHTYYPVVFVDVTGYYNICANLNVEVYKRIKSEAQLVVDLLNDTKINCFPLVFMKQCQPYTQFDHLLKISKPDVIEQLLELHVTPADRCNFAGQGFPLLLKIVTDLLNKGLQKRVKALLPIEKPTEAWPVNVHSTPAASKRLQLGIILDEQHAFEVLDKGPTSIAAEAEEFRKFWGEKAQLRRFQDGTITESVVWASTKDTLRQKRLIVRSIVLHLLNHHLQLEPQDVHYIAGDLDSVFCLNSAYKLPKLHAKCALTQDTDAEAASLYVIHAFDDLSRQLTSLKELPLEITNIAGTSAVFRYCEPLPLLPVARAIGDHFYADIVPRAIIQLGQSGKWPSELGALRALKMAFYLQIAKLLRSKYELKVKVSTSGLLVLKYGYCFALELAHTKELALLKREVNERGIVQYVHSEESRALQKRHYILPRVSAALHSLYQRQPCFGATVMIAKRWLYSQLIDRELWPDEATELLVATLFANRQAELVVCNSPHTGFLRFLSLLANTDWRIEYFLLNFNNVTDATDTSLLEKKFLDERSTYPPLCIGTSFDEEHQGLLWTSPTAPNVHVLARVTILARKALEIVQETLTIKPAQLFYASNEGYDLVIQLKPDLISTAKVPAFGSPFAANSKPNWRLPLADSDYLADAVHCLREAYSDFAAFFYNPCGGKEIGVMWRPHIFDTPKNFKVTEVNGYSLGDNNKLVCKKETLIEDFKLILKDFYLCIGTVNEVLAASTAGQAAQRKKSYRYFAEKKNAEKTET